jgi:DNA polymerase-3 subunit delta'
VSEPIGEPRSSYRLEGLERAEEAFLQALGRGRLHHAWLLTGPEGIGKATFAYRAARRLLGARPAPEYGLLGADPQDTVSRQVAGRAHPDLLVVERRGDDGKMRRQIPVVEARKLGEFFSLTPGEAQYRVAIIDEVDDLNDQGANALLKTLEEPPERGVIFLVSHQPGSLLSTIRSRCRRLAFPAPPEAEAARLVQAAADVNEEEALRLVRMAGGAPGRALRLNDVGALILDDAARSIITGLPRIDHAAMQALSETFRGNDGLERFRILIERLAARLHVQAATRAEEGIAAGLDDWARAWEALQRLPDEVDGLNLDRADALWTALGELRRVA